MSRQEHEQYEQEFERGRNSLATDESHPHEPHSTRAPSQDGVHTNAGANDDHTLRSTDSNNSGSFLQCRQCRHFKPRCLRTAEQ